MQNQLFFLQRQKVLPISVYRSPELPSYPHYLPQHIAKHISGSEKAFAEKMNEKAQEIIP